ncbi:MAG: T9SS type A sorting domain-containing protein [bacterium]
MEINIYHHRNLFLYMCFFVYLVCSPKFSLNMVSPQYISISEISLNSNVYEDRNYVFNAIPQNLEKCKFIRFFCDWKTKGLKDTVAVVELAQAADVLIAVPHERIEKIAFEITWLSEWEDTGDTLFSNEIRYDLYMKKNVSAGKIAFLGQESPAGFSGIISPAQYIPIFSAPGYVSGSSMKIAGIKNQGATLSYGRIMQFSPNPFNNKTRIRFNLAKPQSIKLGVYNINGQLVKALHNGYGAAGRYDIIWKGNNEYGCAQPSGIYFLHLETAYNKIIRKRITLLR